MTVIYIKPATRTLTVHYATSAAHAASTLDERLRGVLNKAIALLGDNPYPPQSEASDSDPLRRVVRASRSLIVIYRAEETRLLIEEVRVERCDTGGGVPESARPSPAAEAPVVGVTEHHPKPSGLWQRIVPARLGAA